MTTTPSRIDRYVDRLTRAAAEAVPTLAKELGIPRAAAAEAYAAAAGLVLAGLARHAKRRPAGAGAASAVVEKFGRLPDLDAPELAIRAHLARPRLSPRLGGLLGDGGRRVCAWLSARTGADDAALGRAVAASAPLALGALASLSRGEVDAWAAAIPDDALEDPARLASPAGPCSEVFRRVRRGSGPWVRRVLRAR